MSRTPNSLSQHPHKAKAYANDPSIISGSLEEHTETVQTINQLSREIDLMICPDKCVTLVWQEENPEKSPDWTPRWLDEINTWKIHRIPRCNNCNFPSVHSLNTQETTGGDLPGPEIHRQQTNMRGIYCLDFPKLCGTVVQISPNSRPYLRQWHQIHPEHCHEVY